MRGRSKSDSTCSPDSRTPLGFHFGPRIASESIFKDFDFPILIFFRRNLMYKNSLKLKPREKFVKLKGRPFWLRKMQTDLVKSTRKPRPFKRSTFGRVLDDLRKIQHWLPCMNSSEHLSQRHDFSMIFPRKISQMAT